MLKLLLVTALLLQACCRPADAPPPVVPEPTERASGAAASIEAIQRMLDGWHAAAARADEEAYFALLSDDAVFLGTDASERWHKEAFRAYAHPHFDAKKAWSFSALRREVILSRDGNIAWFDEDLATPNLGPARGSGVVVKQPDGWRIAHYNLAITVPNERFAEVRELLATPPREKRQDAPPAAD
jgi:ketosteroid isomerase-like protein